MMPYLRLQFLGFLFLCSYTQVVLAQDVPTVQAYRMAVEDAISVDGRVDEPFWQNADVADEFVQSAPVEGAMPSERTEIRIAYDAENLYIGAILFDSDPEGIIGYQKERDAFLSTDDRFMWIMDTFQDGRTGYFFETNPAGLMADALLGGSAFGMTRSWDGIWEVRVAKGSYGWSLEVRIPFSTLNFDPEKDTWGINFQRTIRRKNEEMLWSGYRRNQSLWQPIYAGQVTGLRDLSQGIGLEFKPYAVGSWRHQPDAEKATEWDGDVGMDITYSITSSLRAALTINTDFAEVEADQRRVNLTRFPLFFPERRDFFTEGSGVFSFSPRNGVTPYFSRNIGLVAGQPTPIRYGARIAGQVGGYDLAFLQVRTGALEEYPAEDFTIGRVKRFVGAQSSIGLIFTRRAPRPLDDVDVGPDQHTLGADLELRTATFRGSKNLEFQAFFVGHDREAGDTESDFWDRTTRGFRLNYPNEPFSTHVSYREFGHAFDPALGFNRRNGFRRINPNITIEPRLPKSTLIRQLTFEADYEHLMDLDFQPLTQQLDLTLLGVHLESGDGVSLYAEYVRERLTRDFEIFDAIIIPQDTYGFLAWSLEAGTARRRPISAGIEVSTGSFWSGTRRSLGIGVGIRPLPGISIEPSWEFNDVDLDEGTFRTNVVELEAGWQLNPWVALTTIVQYDDVSELLSLFSRFRWIVNPGNDVYLIFTHNWQRDKEDLFSPHRRFEPLSRGAAVKLNYTHRF